MATNTSRLMESTRPAAGSAPRRRPSNTLAAPDDILDERRYRRYHAHTAASAGSGRQLRENALMLVVLAASIYGLYQLCIYVLNQ